MRSNSTPGDGQVLCLSLLALILAGCATRPAVVLTKPTVVDAACGECLFSLPGKGCDLAVRVDGRSYYVDGVNMDF